MKCPNGGDAATVVTKFNGQGHDIDAKGPTQLAGKVNGARTGTELLRRQWIQGTR